MRMLKSKAGKMGIKVAITVILVFVLIRSVDWEQSFEVVTQANKTLLFFYAILIIVGNVISAKKWKILTDSTGFNLSLWKHFQRYLSGTFVNNFLPSVIGGDMYRALSLGKLNESRSSAVGSVVFDRYTGLVAMAILAVLFSLMNSSAVFEHPFWIIVFVCAVLGSVVQFVILPDKQWSLLAFLSRWFPHRVTKLFSAMEKYRSWNLIFRSLSWGVIFALVGVGIANYILFQALGVSMGFVEFLSVIFFINIIAALPLSINNIGVKEWAYYIFFGYLGVAPEVSVTAAILSRFIQMGISLFGAGAILFSKKELSSLQKEGVHD